MRKADVSPLKRSDITLDAMFEAAHRMFNEVADDVDDDIPTTQEIRERLVALETMVRTDGWKVFCRYVEWMINAAEKSMADAESAHAMAKHMGAFYTMRQLITWPIRESEALRRTLKENP